MNLDEFKKNYPSKRVIIHSKEWNYLVRGKGKVAFVIFPGGGQSAESTFELIQAFENRYKVIAITITTSDSINEFTHAIKEILKKEQVEKIILYGLSIGGMLALSFLKQNKSIVNKLILSHTCTPKSTLYKKKVIIPLKLASILLPITPNFMIRLIARLRAGKIQGVNAQEHKRLTEKMDKDKLNLYMDINKEFIRRHFNRRTIQTWIKLHTDFYYNQTFSKKDFEDWNGNALILKTDNDPLIQDEGVLKKIFPHAKVYTFKDTGHLTFFYKSTEITCVVKSFVPA